MAITLRTPVKMASVVNPITRNSLVAGQLRRDGMGPFAALRVATGDYRMWGETFNGTDYGIPGVTNGATYYTSPNGIAQTLITEGLILPSAAAPDNGEFCPVSLVWNPEEQLWFLYGHIGGNAGPRNTVLYTSPSILNGGTWTRSQTVLVPDQVYEGFGGPVASQLASDFKVKRLSSGNWLGYYRAGGTGALSGVAVATSTNGRAWTKGGTVLVPSGAGFDATLVSLNDWYIDANGRVHLWYVGNNGIPQEIGYAWSDNKTAFTRVGSVLAGSGTIGAYDKLVVSQVNIIDDGDLILVGFGAMNLDDYAGAGGFPLRSNALSFTPKEATATPAQPGRHFHAVASRVTWPAANAFMLANAVWSLYVECKAPTWRAAAGGRGGLHTEWNAFNILSALYHTKDGKVEFFYRDGTNTFVITTAAAFDDNVLDYILVRRISASSFEVYVNGTLVGTSIATAITNAAVPIVCTGGWAPTATGDEPAYSTVRRVVGISGYAMTAAEATTIFNNGAGNGALPGSGVKKIDARPGNGGAAGPDTEASASLSNGTVAAGAIMVDAALPAAIALSGALGRHRKTHLSIGVGL